MPTMTIEEARKHRDMIQQRVAQLSHTSYREKQVERMRWLVAGTLDKWLGKELRHALVDFLFEDTEGGSTKSLGGPQLTALLEWMKLGHDDLNGYYSTSESLATKETMREIAMVVQPGLPGMPGPVIAHLEVVDANL